jgi:hypothetical protein
MVSKGSGLVAVLAALALAMPVEAQQNASSSFSSYPGMFFTVNPNPIQVTPIDLSKSVTVMNTSAALHQPSTMKPFFPNLMSTFPFTLLPFSHGTPPQMLTIPAQH